MLARYSCSDDRGGHELAVRPGHVAGPEGVLIKEGQMSKTTDLFAVSAAALILACRRMGNLRYASPCCRPGDGSDRPPHNDDERKTDAPRALCGLFLRIQLSEISFRLEPRSARSGVFSWRGPRL